MTFYKGRKTAFINRQIAMAAGITASCVALLILCHAMTQTRGIMKKLLKRVYDKIKSYGGNGGAATDILYEEDTGDSYKI